MCSINILNLFLTIYKGFDEVINLKNFRGDNWEFGSDYCIYL